MQTQTSKNKYWTPKDGVRKKYQTNSVRDNDQELC